MFQQDHNTADAKTNLILTTARWQIEIYKAMWVVFCFFLHLATYIRLSKREWTEIKYKRRKNTEVDAAVIRWPKVRHMPLCILRSTLQRKIIIHFLSVRSIQEEPMLFLPPFAIFTILTSSTPLNA